MALDEEGDGYAINLKSTKFCVYGWEEHVCRACPDVSPVKNIIQS